MSNMRGLICLLKRSRIIYGGFQAQKICPYHDLALAGRIGSRLEATSSDFEVKSYCTPNLMFIMFLGSMVYTATKNELIFCSNHMK